MECPYDRLELNLAMRSVESKLTDELKSRLEKEFDPKSVFPQNQSDQNKQIAKYHGISVTDLIHSPNYLILVGQWEEQFLKEIITKLTKFGLTEKEVWAVILMLNGKLE